MSRLLFLFNHNLRFEGWVRIEDRRSWVTIRWNRMIDLEGCGVLEVEFHDTRSKKGPTIIMVGPLCLSNKSAGYVKKVSELGRPYLLLDPYHCRCSHYGHGQ